MDAQNVSLEIKAAWPNATLSSASVANQFLIADAAPTRAGTPDDGFYIAFGHLAPPSFSDEELRELGQRGESVSLAIDAQAVVFLTRSRAYELIQMLQEHLSQQQVGDPATHRASQ